MFLRSVFLACLVTVCGSVGNAAGQDAAGVLPAVVYEDILGALRSGQSEDQLIDMLNRSSVIFVLDARQQQELESFGASPKLIAVIQGNRAQPGDIVNLAVILDCSGSMREKTRTGKTKMAVAKQVVTDLINRVPDGLKLSFVVYGHDKQLRCKAVTVVRPLSEIDQSVKAELNALISKISPEGATPIAGALNAAANQLAGAAGDSSVVLISDGKETCRGNPAAVAYALSQSLKLPKGKGVNVIGFDVNDEDRTALTEIAVAGDGRYFDAKTSNDFAKIFEKVAPLKLEPRPEPPKSQAYFSEDFSGELSDHWHVVNRDDESFIVEDGRLLILNSTPGSLAKNDIPNLFRLNVPMPESDWTMTMQLQADIQTGKEKIAFGLYEDRKNYLMAAADFYPGSYNAAMFDLRSLKASKGKTSEFKREVWRGPGHKSIVEQTRTLPNPILLRLEKKGRSYVASAKLSGDESEWVEMEKLTALRATGTLAVALYQKAEVTGESTIAIDWIKVDAN